MSDFIEIPAENIIEESQTENPNYNNIHYIVYLNPADPRRKIHINAYYRPYGKKVRICRYYDRGLCDTLEEYQQLRSFSRNDIESQASGAYMDGARG